MKKQFWHLDKVNQRLFISILFAISIALTIFESICVYALGVGLLTNVGREYFETAPREYYSELITHGIIFGISIFGLWNCIRIYKIDEKRKDPIASNGIKANIFEEDIEKILNSHDIDYTKKEDVNHSEIITKDFSCKIGWGYFDPYIMFSTSKASFRILIKDCWAISFSNDVITIRTLEITTVYRLKIGDKENE